MTVKRRLLNAGFRALNMTHRSVLRLSGGRLGWRAFKMPIIELRTIGRSSGLTRTTMLTVPVVDGDRLVLVASKGGGDHDPHWYQNLVAHPDVEVKMAQRTRLMIARTATEAQKLELWPKVVAAYKPYETYQRRAKRVIPLVICEPRSVSDT